MRKYPNNLWRMVGWEWDTPGFKCPTCQQKDTAILILLDTLVLVDKEGEPTGKHDGVVSARCPNCRNLEKGIIKGYLFYKYLPLWKLRNTNGVKK